MKTDLIMREALFVIEAMRGICFRTQVSQEEIQASVRFISSSWNLVGSIWGLSDGQQETGALVHCYGLEFVAKTQSISLALSDKVAGAQATGKN
jgi:hypothetical protein